MILQQKATKKRKKKRANMRQSWKNFTKLSNSYLAKRRRVALVLTTSVPIVMLSLKKVQLIISVKTARRSSTNSIAMTNTNVISSICKTVNRIIRPTKKKYDGQQHYFYISLDYKYKHHISSISVSTELDCSRIVQFML